MAEQANKWFGMRVTPSQKAKIERLAEQKGQSQKEAVMEAIENMLREEKPIVAEPGSVLELTRDLCGSIDDPDLPTDLSTNPEHMKDYGKD